MSRLFAGIDGGQSTTVAAIGDESGRILARGTAGPADEIGAGATSTRLRDALRAALDAARARAGLPPETRFTAIVAGVSGYEGRVFGEPPELPALRCTLTHDAPIAHAGALGGEPGIVVIAGTGSVVYMHDGNRSLTLGGWGFLFGDEGSAFWLAREAIAALMRSEDCGRTSLEEEARRACAFFGVSSLRELARAFYGTAIARDRLAAYAGHALENGDAREIADRGADALADLACRAIERGAPPVAVLVGGMFLDASFRRRVIERIHETSAGVQIREPRYDPAAGALLLAYREAGLRIEELH